MNSVLFRLFLMVVSTCSCLLAAGPQFEVIHRLPVGPTPSRVTEVEAMLIGQAANDQTIANAAQMAHDLLHPRTSKYRATAEYRSEMIDTLLRRALTLAVSRARTGEVVPEGIGA